MNLAYNVDRIKHLIADDYANVKDRINADTERFRKGFANLLIRRNGDEVTSARVNYKLKRHEFAFGCNAFMYGEFPDDEQNSTYAEKFSHMFNLAVIPFYWDTYEPEDGYSRYHKSSKKIYRRPPVDLLVEFCENNNIYGKGHCLAYRDFEPAWLPRNPRDYLNRLERHFREIAERYGARIPIWDIVNEVYCKDKSKGQHPWDYIEHALSLGAKYLPEGAVKIVNEATNICWHYFDREYSMLPMLLDDLRSQGYKFDCAGLQFHMFKPDIREYFHESYARLLRCSNILAYLDSFCEYDIPMQVSEITIPGANISGGEELQAQIAEMLYRTWFSHPLMRGIIWWNLVDNTAAFAPIGMDGGENNTKGGMLNDDMSEKQVFRVLKDLIHLEWTTEGVLHYHKSGDDFALAASANKFHGYYGDYDLEIILPDNTVSKHSIKLSHECGTQFCLELK